MQSIMKIQFAGQELLTGLPEYRNGGLFVDLGVLTLKPEDQERGLKHYTEYSQRTGTGGVEVAPMFDPGDDVIVEWRGVTVGFLDMLTTDVNKALRNELAGHELSLAQVLEAGSWKVCIALCVPFWRSTANTDGRVDEKLLKLAGRIPRNRRFSSTATGRCSRRVAIGSGQTFGKKGVEEGYYCMVGLALHAVRTALSGLGAGVDGFTGVYHDIWRHAISSCFMSLGRTDRSLRKQIRSLVFSLRWSLMLTFAAPGSLTFSIDLFYSISTRFCSSK
jgi:hypothetical protein